MTRLAVACGGCPETLAGLAGLGDLVLTCTGALSRNRSVGVELGRGRRLPEIVAEMHWRCSGRGIYDRSRLRSRARIRSRNSNHATDVRDPAKRQAP